MRNLVKTCITIGGAVFISIANPLYTIHENAMEEDTITSSSYNTPPQLLTVGAIAVNEINEPTSSAIQYKYSIQIQQARKIKENTLYYVRDEGGCRYDLAPQYQDYLYKLCKRYGIKEYYKLLLAQMYHESNFHINEVSNTNDYGLMQINTCNFSWLRKKLGINDFLDPYDSIKAGTYMMSRYLKKYGNAHKALVCYNMGEGKLKSGIVSSTYSRGVIHDISLLRKRKRGE